MGVFRLLRLSCGNVLDEIKKLMNPPPQPEPSRGQIGSCEREGRCAETENKGMRDRVLDIEEELSST